MLSGLLGLPVTLCFRCARCLAKVIPDLTFSACFSNSVLVSLHNSVPVLGNFSGSGSGFKENLELHHDNHDRICLLFHSEGSEN